MASIDELRKKYDYKKPVYIIRTVILVALILVAGYFINDKMEKSYYQSLLAMDDALSTGLELTVEAEELIGTKFKDEGLDAATAYVASDDFAELKEEIKASYTHISDCGKDLSNAPYRYKAEYEVLDNLYQKYFAYATYALNPTGTYEEYHENCVTSYADVESAQIAVEALGF